MSVASLADIERDWNVDDVAIANEALDLLEHAEAEAYRRASAKAENDARTRRGR